MGKDALFQRDLGLDLTRIFAFISVPGVHFFLNSGFYSTPMTGERMYVMMAVRTFFMICVPLFMLLSGYLMAEKRIPLEKGSLLNFYAKITKIVVAYVLATVAILVFRRMYLQEDIGFKSGLLNLLRYDQYSWYVEMYLGFFVLIPFLNAVWGAIHDRGGQRILVAVLLVFTMAPSIFNIWDLTTEGALIHPWLSPSDSYSQLIPSWWTTLYPITYYYVGAYLKSNVRIKDLKTWKLVAMLIVCVVVFGIFNVWRCYSVEFIWGSWSTWGSFQNVVDTVLVFLIINSIRYQKIPPLVRKTVALLSELAFGAYILSWIPDHYAYPKLIAAVPNMPTRFNYFPVMVLHTVLVSLALSLVLHLVMHWGGRLFRLVRGDSGKRTPAVDLEALPK